jgi:hypothetical protein
MKLDPEPHEAEPCNERTNLAIYEPSIRPQVLESDKPDGSPPHHCEGYGAIQINPYTRKQLRIEYLDSHYTLPCDWTRVLRYRQEKVDDNIELAPDCQRTELALYCCKSTTKALQRTNRHESLTRKKKAGEHTLSQSMNE